MGTIASVLQWTCTNCNLINPTECLKCLQCGNIRKIHDGNDGTNFCTNGDENGIDEQRNATTNSNNGTVKHKTLPGYVEISTNG